MEWHLNNLGGQQIAVRPGITLTYLHADPLGSASLATTVTGTLVSQRRYLPYGETRWSSGPFPTDRRFTGQREEVTLGVYDYGARFYSPGLGRFLSADTLVPEAGRPQSLNRYMYTLGNPLKYVDPTGHLTEIELRTLLGDKYDQLMALWNTYDPYWVTILTTLQAGGELQASGLGNLILNFNGSGANITAEVLGGDYTARLEAWQGQGVYRIENPGMSDVEAATLRDTLVAPFLSFTPEIGHYLVSPVFDYRTGHGRPEYMGARVTSQVLGKGQISGSITEAGKAALGDLESNRPAIADFLVNTTLTVASLFAPPPWNIRAAIACGYKIFADIGASYYATSVAPKSYINSLTIDISLTQVRQSWGAK